MHTFWFQQINEMKGIMRIFVGSTPILDPLRHANYSQSTAQRPAWKTVFKFSSFNLCLQIQLQLFDIYKTSVDMTNCI